MNPRFGSLRNKILVIIIVMIFVPRMSPCFGQSDIYLQHQLKPDRQKKISFKKEYEIQTADTVFYHHQISYFSDDTLLLSSNCCPGPFKLAFSDITSIEKSRKYGGFEIIATIGMIALSITPVIWATEGNEAALEMLEVSGVFLACSVPVLLLKQAGRKKDTTTKWKICTG